MTLFSKKVFADVVKGLETRRSSWIIQMGLKQVSSRRGQRGGKGDMKKSDDDDMSDNATSQDTAEGV